MACPTLARYGAFGLSSVLVLRVLRFNPFQELDSRGWLRIIGIGFSGNTLYYAAMSGAVATIGPAPVSLVFGRDAAAAAAAGEHGGHEFGSGRDTD